MKLSPATAIVARCLPFFIFSNVVWLLLLPQSAQGQACDRQQDSLALVQLHNAMNGPNWTFSWNLPQSMNNWFGVTLNPQGCVQKVAVTSGAVGQLPDLQLPHLEELQLGHNQEVPNTTTIPNFSGMTNLKKLNLGLNLSGSIPNFSYLPKLEELVLVDVLGNQHDGLTGTVPNFNNLPLLVSLRFSNHSLTSVPDFTNLPSLQFFDLSRNKLVSVPDFQHLDALKNLDLSTNPFPNGLPNFSALQGLEKLTVLGSDLNGLFPNFTQLIGLKELRLGGVVIASVVAEADLNGLIPDYDMPTLEKLTLQYVRTNSVIPDFAHLPNLKTLTITGKNLSGELPDFAHLPKLTDLRIGGYTETIIPFRSDITGAVPNFSNFPALKNLDLCFNRLSGDPTNFSNLPQANKIDLSWNNLSGTVPDFSMLPSVDDIFLNNNGLVAINSQLNTPGKVKVSNNLLTFEDLLPVLGELGTYWEQDSIPVQPIYATNGNGNLEIDLLFDENVQGSTYAWFKNNLPIGTTTTNKLELAPGSCATGDKLAVRVTNPVAPNLQLNTKPFSCSPTTATSERNGKILINVMPNPATDWMFVKANTESLKPMLVRVFNPFGQLVQTAYTVNGLAEIATHDLQSGTYFISINTEFGVATEKVVVLK